MFNRKTDHRPHLAPPSDDRPTLRSIAPEWAERFDRWIALVQREEGAAGELGALSNKSPISAAIPPRCRCRRVLLRPAITGQASAKNSGSCPVPNRGSTSRRARRRAEGEGRGAFGGACRYRRCKESAPARATRLQFRRQRLLVEMLMPDYRVIADRIVAVLLELGVAWARARRISRPDREAGRQHGDAAAPRRKRAARAAAGHRDSAPAGGRARPCRSGNRTAGNFEEIIRVRQIPRRCAPALQAGRRSRRTGVVRPFDPRGSQKIRPHDGARRRSRRANRSRREGTRSAHRDAGGCLPARARIDWAEEHRAAARFPRPCLRGLRGIFAAATRASPTSSGS